MRTMIATLLATLLATQAQAESWGGRDKWQHAIVGAGTGAVFAKATNDWRYGCAAAAAGCGSSIVVAPNYIGFNIKF